ncbi:hypothetical protein GCM10010193_54200 [Kitasatospora atroaurantiaca]|uniref:VanZ like protein n=1 Tax=Kitasatospora atroaurantiaca TaxID=285545 RepID=A0A561EQ03_9ACTN|nr:VanZ family protein [Kitasatospora atroaurantiaca]TWE17691.1 VanZ like protein [Kitasatospora atroaurantiaca]
MQRDGTTTRPERETGARAGDDPTDMAYTPPPAPGVSQRLRALGLLLLTGYLALVGWLVLRPLTAGWTYPANLTPFASVHQALAVGGLAGARQLAAGLVPLAPLGVLLPLVACGLRTAWLPSFLRTVGSAALLATGLEILKSWTPGHVLNVDNILLGTLGVALCHLAVVPAARACLLRERPPRARVRERTGTVAVTHPRTYELAAPAPSLSSLSPSGTSTRR